MVEIDGKKYFTQEEMQNANDCFNYILNFKDAMNECYRNQVVVLEEMLDKLLIEIKEKNNEKTSY